MEVIVSSESTYDVANSELQLLDTFEQWLSEALAPVEFSDLRSIGLIYVIMNPKVAPPFPSGVIYRRIRKMLDVKVFIEFEEWKSRDYSSRIQLLASEAISMIKSDVKVSTNSKNKIIDAIDGIASVHGNAGGGDSVH